MLSTPGIDAPFAMPSNGVFHHVAVSRGKQSVIALEPFLRHAPR